MKKKLISILLCIVAVATMAGCGQKIDREALKEELRAEIEEEMEEEEKEKSKKEEREKEKEEKEKEEPEEIIEDEPDEEEVTPSKEPVAGSDEWSSLTFVLDGETYTVPFSYSDIKSDWSFDMADYGYEDGYILNPGEYVYATVDLENDTYDCDFTVGLKNYSKSALDITECDIWAASVEITWADSYPTLELPGGLTWGSSLEEVEAVYGIPEDTYRSDSLGYWSYDYNIDNTYYLSLTIYDDRGLVEFGYSSYD